MEPNPQMLEIKDQMAKALLEMNSTVVESIHTGVSTVCDDPLEVLQAAVRMTTLSTLDVIDEFAQIFPKGQDLGCMPFFDGGELQTAFESTYADAINS